MDVETSSVFINISWTNCLSFAVYIVVLPSQSNTEVYKLCDNRLHLLNSVTGVCTFTSFDEAVKVSITIIISFQLYARSRKLAGLHVSHISRFFQPVLYIEHFYELRKQ